METIKLYYENPYNKEFEATIVDIKEHDDQVEIVLDRTLFYPLGGGQPADKGCIMGHEVLDVKNKDGVISHYLKSFENYKIGDKVDGKIDWKTRYEHMQCHTAEHLVTGVARELYGCDNVGFNISDNYMTIDLNVDLTLKQVEELEILVNERILTNAKVDISYPEPEVLKNLEYRSKIELLDNVRIVNVENIDVCACCGLHCYNTLEIGIIKFISWKRHRGGVRLICLAGTRALRDYIQKHNYILELTECLSAKEDEIVERVNKLSKEVKEVKFKEKEAKTELLKFKVKEFNSAVFYEDGLDFYDMKTVVNLLQEKVKVAVILSKGDDGVKYLFGSKTEDVRNFNKEICEKFSGKGGGQSSLVQGTLNGDFEDVLQFVNGYKL